MYELNVDELDEVNGGGLAGAAIGGAIGAVGGFFAGAAGAAFGSNTQSVSSAMFNIGMAVVNGATIGSGVGLVGQVSVAVGTLVGNEVVSEAISTDE